MIAEIVSIGDELLIGQVVNTNASWIAGQLHSLGFSIRQVTAISDDRNEISTAIENALSRSDVVLLTGGLGPTKDDITKHVLCEYFGTTLILHEPSLDLIKKLFAARGWELSEHNRKQAEVPVGCTPVPNHLGTAPGMWFEKDGKVLVSMPGVPFEMEAMMENYVLPKIALRHHQQVVVHKTIQTQGVGESRLMEMISEWEDALPPNFKLAYLPQPGIVRLRLTASDSTRESAMEQLDEQVKALRSLIPDLIFGYDNETLEEVVGKLLRQRQATLSAAESCTGGYISHLITSVPGSSDYFSGSVIAYANEIKHHFLGVTEESLKKYGAVSEQVVTEMAAGARKRFGTGFALATSGIAGPDGGTPEKPVGLVWIALATRQGVITKKAMYGEHRGRNIRRSALDALNMLRLELLKK
jgi:nicotinamide-nucleotide amidase